MNNIFIVTMLTEISYFEFGEDYDRRVVGWFKTLAEAEGCLKVNCGDVHECRYDYAVIEEVQPGFYSGAKAPQSWYEWDSELEGYKSIERPEQWFGLTAIGIG